MNTLDSIFKSVTTLRKAKQTEDSMASLEVNTLEEALLMGTSFSKEKANAVLLKRTELVSYLNGFNSNGEQIANNQDQGGWKQFRIYNTGECKFMYFRSEFVCNLRNKYPDLYKQLSNPNITHATLKQLSLTELSIRYPNITWAIKLLACAKGIDFRGIQSSTTPVRKATFMLFPEENTDQFSHTMLCERLSEILNISPMTINTILYNIGSSK